MVNTIQVKLSAWKRHWFLYQWDSVKKKVHVMSKEREATVKWVERYRRKYAEGGSQSPRHLDLSPLWSHRFFLGIVETQTKSILYSFLEHSWGFLLHWLWLGAEQEKFPDIWGIFFWIPGLQYILGDLS